MIRYQRSADLPSFPIHGTTALQRGQLLLPKLSDRAEFADHPAEAGQYQASDDAGNGPDQRGRHHDKAALPAAYALHEQHQNEKDEADTCRADEFEYAAHANTSACMEVEAYRASAVLEILKARGSTECTAIVHRLTCAVLAVLAEKPTVTIDDIIRRGWSRATVLRLGPEAVERARKALSDHRATMATN